MVKITSPRRRTKDLPALESFGFGASSGSDLRDASRIIVRSFVHDVSAEGSEFWGSVCRRLWELAEMSDRHQEDRKQKEHAEGASLYAAPTGCAGEIDILGWLTDADGLAVRTMRNNESAKATEWAVYLHMITGRLQWIADFAVGENENEFSEEQARDCAYDYAEALMEKYPRLKARGIINTLEWKE
jgi:hypothetical protein